MFMFEKADYFGMFLAPLNQVSIREGGRLCFNVTMLRCWGHIEALGARVM